MDTPDRRSTVTAPLPNLRAKRERRKAQHERQLKLWRKSGKRGHGRAARRAAHAIAVLTKLIRRAFRRIDWNGNEPVKGRQIRKAARVALSVPGVYVTSTTGGTHSATSYHYQGRAIDFGSDDYTNNSEAQAQARLSDKFGDGYFTELFGPADWYVKDGNRSPGTFPAHHDHLHLAI